MCVADTRAEAEDIAAQVAVEYEELPAVVDMLKAQQPGASLVHDTIKRNVFLEVGFDGPVEAAAKTAPVKVTRELRTARQVMSPIECRGFVAHVGAAPAPADTAWRNAVSACRPHRPRAGPANSRNPDPRDLVRRRRRLRLQGDPGRARKSACAGWRCAAAIRCAGWRTGASSSPPTPTAASTTTPSPPTPTSTASSSPSTPRPRSIPAPTRPIRSPRRSSRRRSRRSCPGPYDIPVYRCKIGGRRHQQVPAAALSRRRAPERLLRDGADGRRDRAQDRQGALRGAARQSACAPTRCRSTTSPTSISTAATIRNFCARRSTAIDLPAVRARQKRGEPDGRLIGLGISRLLRADRARHHRRRQAPRALRAGVRPHHARRTARSARRHPEHRPGP